ncbi:hypothetical protein XENOCAPTIV_019460 [Xenoophorus captivus]|uniref:Uncharacterized protein n=1 Tax=Xenoophorus captivus TaxID=1517983 RepID=A0ABV0R2T5_9TELE
METAYLSPRRGGTRPESLRGPSAAGVPSPPASPNGVSPEETPSQGEGRRNSGVKKHHHKHNLKHRYELLETLGRGTYGKVKKAIERHSGRESCSHKRVIVLLPSRWEFPIRSKIRPMGPGVVQHTPCPVHCLPTGC